MKKAAALKNKKILFFGIGALCLLYMLVCYSVGLRMLDEKVFYYLMTAVVTVIFAAISLPPLFKKRFKPLLKPVPALFGAAMCVAFHPFALSLTPFLKRCALYLAVFVLFWLLFAGFGEYLESKSKKREPVCGENINPNAVFFVFFAFSLAGLLLVWRTYPNASSPDVVNQSMQIHGEIPYSNIHAIAHTLFLKLLYDIYDDQKIAVLVNIISVAFVYALFARMLCKKGANIGWMLILTALSISDERFARVYIFPWKDTPYSFCLAILAYLTIELLDKKGKIKTGTAVLAGALIALAALFRLNGVIAAAVIAFIFIVWLIKAKKFACAVSLVLCAVIVYGGVSMACDRILKPEKPSNGFSLQFFAAGIAAAKVNGNLTEEQKKKLETMFDSDWIERKYSKWSARNLIWDFQDGADAEKFKDPEMVVFNNDFVLDLGKDKAEVIKLYLSLLPSNFAVMLAEAFRGCWIVWGMDNTGYFDSNIFMCLLMLFAVITLWKKKRGDLKYLAVFAGIVFNAASIMILTITNEKRYLLITFMLFPALMPYIAAKGRGKADE